MLYKKILPILLFVSLLAGGFLLPGAANPIQESQVENIAQPNNIITVCADMGACDYTRIQTAIVHANPAGGDIIALASEVYTETITIDKSLTISGTGYVSTTLQAVGEGDIATTRVIQVTDGITVAIKGITIQLGNVEGEGGGIHNQGMLTVQNSRVISNTSDSDGGGIFNQGVLIVENSRIANNTAVNGGGIANIPEIGLATTTITNTTIRNNDATVSGAGVYNNARDSATNAELTLTASTLENNQLEQALSTGGGAANMAELGHSTMAIFNSTFSANTAEFGGGFYIQSSITDTITTTLEHVTFFGNLADDGSNLYVENGNTLLKHSILAYGQESADCYVDENTTITDGGFNLIEDGSCGFPASGDPRLSALAKHGGDTETHALLGNSPALDIIAPDQCSTAMDQRGIARPYGVGCDSGAYENNYTELAFYPRAEKSNIKPGGMVTFTISVDLIGPGITNGLISANLPEELTAQDPSIVLDPPDSGEIGTLPTLAHSIVISANHSFTLTMYANIVEGLSAGTVLSSTFSLESQETPIPREDTIFLDIINVPPVAVDDHGIGFLTNPDTDLFYTGNVLNNDYDLNGDTLIIHDIVTDTLHGIVKQVDNTGIFTYDPNGQFDNMIPGQTEVDVFTYYILDGHGSVGEAATVTIRLRKDANTIYLPFVAK